MRLIKLHLAALLPIAVIPAYFALSQRTPVHAAAKGPDFVEFESGHVRPLALSPDGNTLFAVNTPNGTLEIFDLSTGSAVFKTRVPVGLEPVAVAARNNTEVWVANHLSDSVSVVSLTGTPHVAQTLLVGDEPRDIVFAGNPDSPRAFITTAHRGQRRTDPALAKVPGAGDPQLTTPGIPRADVWVFDGPVEIPTKIVSVFTDTPRALAVSPDKQTVYVAGFKTGNQTTSVMEGRVCVGFENKPCKLADGSTSPGGNPGPATDAANEPAPEVGIIVRYNNASGHWEDELHRNWDGSVRFTLPDTDVFAIDANTLLQTASAAHVGTTLFNMAANPVNGKLYVTNTESFNDVRFEGPGAFGGKTVQGHLAESRITVLDGKSVLPRRLNKHIDYTKLAGNPGFDADAKNHSLSMPLEMAISADGARVYVAAFGSGTIGILDSQRLENDTLDPVNDSAAYMPVSGGGVSGVVLDEARGVLYAMTRFDNAVKVMDLASYAETAALPLPNPEPASVVKGRAVLYDATKFSGNGEATCASCHIFGDMDDLAWDLGNPDDVVKASPIPINLGALFNILAQNNATGLSSKINGSGNIAEFHPMKGPMTTQTLRGLKNSGAMHWRGDRSVGAYGSSASDANTSFKNFIGAFQGLVGTVDQPSDADMQRFADFQLSVMLPPNPIRNLDNSLTASQRRGLNFYSGARASDGVVTNPTIEALAGGKTSFSCNGCHTLDASNGFFGTGGNQSFEVQTQTVKIPHLRNQYVKIGMFGAPRVSFFNLGDSGQMGDQIRGFGFLADGSTDTLFRFFNAAVFAPTGNSGFPQNTPDTTRRDVEQLVLAFDTDLAPIVGQQVTLTSTNADSASPRIDLLLQRAGAPFTSKSLGGDVVECDVVANVVINGRIMGFLYDPAAANFIPDDGTDRVTDATLRALAATPRSEITYTATTPGSGPRIAFMGVPAPTSSLVQSRGRSKSRR